jgi:hypothetical protein
MTQPPYVPPHNDDTNSPDYTWPPAQETPVPDAERTDTVYSDGAYAQESYVEPVSSVYVADAPLADAPLYDAPLYDAPVEDPSTTDVAKEQAGAVKDTAVEQGQQVAGVAKEQAGAVKDTAVEQGQHVAGVAKEQAGAVKDTAVEQGQHVAEVAKEQAGQVASEASAHVKDLLAEGLTEIRSQAGSQQKRLATGIHSLAGELDSMASKSDKSGPLTDYAHQAADKGAEVAAWLESAEPSDVLDTLRSFARRRPLAFLAASAAAGIVVGRLTRGLVGNAKDDAQTAALTATPTTTSSAQYAVEPARENISLEEIPTSGTGAGYTTDAPDYVADDATLPYGTGTNTGTGTYDGGYNGAAR